MDLKLKIFQEELRNNIINKISNNENLNKESLLKFKNEIINKYETSESLYEIKSLNDFLKKIFYYSVLKKQNYNMHEIIQFCFPNDFIYPFKFQRSNWNDENIKLWYLWYLWYYNKSEIINFKLTKNILNDNYAKGLYSKFKDMNKLINKLKYLFKNDTEILKTILNIDLTRINYWTNKENVEKEIINLMKKLSLDYTNKNDYYKLNRTHFEDNNLTGLLKHYNMSVIQLFKKIYPELNLLEYKFCKCPANYFEDIKNIILYLTETFYELELIPEKNLDLIKDEQLYSIKYDDLNGNLLKRYNHSVSTLFKNVFPDRELLEWKFINAPQGFWQDEKNIKKFLDWLFKILNYENIEDWYKITCIDYRNNYGSHEAYGKNKKYNSINDMIVKLCSTNETKLLPWKFKCIEDNFWENIENKKNYLNWLFKNLNYENSEDWYKISISDFKNNYGRGAFLRGGFMNILCKIYNLNENKFIRYNSELLVCQYIKELFSEYKFQKIRPDWLKNITGSNLELDYYCEQLKLAFEYNGIQHYEYTPHFHKNGIEEFNKQQEKDKLKKKLCEENDVYLIVIPYQYNCGNEEKLYKYIDEKIREWKRETNQEF